VTDNILETVLKVTGLDQVTQQFRDFGDAGAKAFDEVAKAADQATAPMTKAATAATAQRTALAGASTAVNGLSAAYRNVTGSINQVAAPTLAWLAATRAVAPAATQAAQGVGLISTATRALGSATSGLGGVFGGLRGLFASTAASAQGLNVSYRDMRIAMAPLRALAGELGVSLGGLGGIVRASRAGFIAFGGVVAAGVTIALAQAGDAAKRLQAQLTALTGSPTKGKAAFDGLDKAAKGAEVSISAVADAYQQLINIQQKINAQKGIVLPPNSESQIGATDKAMAEFVVTIDRLATSQGKTREESLKLQQQLIEIATAVDKDGKLVGLTAEAFNKLRQTAPEVARAFQQGFAPFATLEQVEQRLRNQGPASISQFISAINKIKPATDAAFASYTKTVPQQIQAVKDKWEELQRAFNEAGGFDFVTNAIKNVSKDLDDLAKKGFWGTLKENFKLVTTDGASAFGGLGTEINKAGEEGNGIFGRLLGTIRTFFNDLRTNFSGLRKLTDLEALKDDFVAVGLAMETLKVPEGLAAKLRELGSTRSLNPIKTDADVVKAEFDALGKSIDEADKKVQKLTISKEKVPQLKVETDDTARIIREQGASERKAEAEQKAALAAQGFTNQIQEQIDQTNKLVEQFQPFVDNLKKVDDTKVPDIEIKSNVPEEAKKSESALDSLKGAFEQLKNFITPILQQLNPVSSAGAAELGGQGQGQAAGFIQPFQDAATQLQTIFSQMATQAQTTADQIKQAFEGVGSAFDDLANRAESAMERAVAAMQRLIDAAKQAADAVKSAGDAGGGDLGGLQFAGGGHVRGPGTTTSDSIWARLSRDEFVVNAREVANVGLDFMHALNSGRIWDYLANVFGGVRGFSMGGLVDGISSRIIMPSFSPSIVTAKVKAPGYAGGGPVSGSFNLKINGQSVGVIHASEATARNIRKAESELELMSARQKIRRNGPSQNWDR